MTKAAAEARREYKRNWAKNNPDKVRAQQERYWTKRAAETARKSSEATYTAEEEVVNPEPAQA